MSSPQTTPHEKALDVACVTSLIYQGSQCLRLENAIVLLLSLCLRQRLDICIDRLWHGAKYKKMV